jgi:hypothetical protein
MPIDASIYQGIKPLQIESQTNNLANMLNLQGLQQSGQLNALKMQEAQRGVEQQNSLRSILSGVQPTDTPDAIAQRLMQGGMLKESLDYRKMHRENQKNEAATAKDMADVVTKRTEWYKNQLSNVKTPQDAAGWVQAQYKDQYLSPLFSSLGSFEDSIKKIPQDPAEFNGWVQNQALNMEKFIELNKPSYHTENLGNISETTMRPGLGGAPTIVSSKAINQSPSSIAEIASREKIAADSKAQAERHFQQNKAIQLGQGGKAPAGYRYLPDGSMEAIPGGPADVKAQALAGNKAAGAADVDSAIATLRDAYGRLEAGGGITSTNKGAIGNTAAALSSSGLGQVVGKTLGTANQSARNDIAMTRPALLAALMKATGMSAKQMDSNAELKLWMATATDPTLDVESNRRALDAIERKYIGGGQSAPTQAPAKPTTLSGADAQAAEWAKANPNDPRAAAIKQRLGL